MRFNFIKCAEVHNPSTQGVYKKKNPVRGGAVFFSTKDLGSLYMCYKVSSLKEKTRLRKILTPENRKYNEATDYSDNLMVHM